MGDDSRKASDVDFHVGQQVRLRRQSLGLSQHELAERVGIRFQQVQKYEKGTNRISAGRLFEFSGILGVPVSWFFEGLPATPTAEPDRNQYARLLSDPVALRAVASLMRIQDRKIRLQLVKTIEALAGED